MIFERLTAKKFGSTDAFNGFSLYFVETIHHSMIVFNRVSYVKLDFIKIEFFGIFQEF